VLLTVVPVGENASPDSLLLEPRRPLRRRGKRTGPRRFASDATEGTDRRADRSLSERVRRTVPARVDAWSRRRPPR
jgi:hypothetical protein